MKLSHWAKEQGINYKTAYLWFRNGTLPVKAEQLPTGTILVYPEINQHKKDNVYIYTRVSTYERKDCLDGQVERCKQFTLAKGLSVNHTIKEIASGMNDNRPKLMKMLNDKPTHIIVENKDRLTRFGFNYLEVLLKNQGCEIIVINHSEEEEHDLMQDLISVVTSFCCRLYGLRRGNKKAKEFKDNLDK